MSNFLSFNGENSAAKVHTCSHGRRRPMTAHSYLATAERSTCELTRSSARELAWKLAGGVRGRTTTSQRRGQRVKRSAFCGHERMIEMPETMMMTMGICSRNINAGSVAVAYVPRWPNSILLFYFRVFLGISVSPLHRISSVDQRFARFGCPSIFISFWVVKACPSLSPLPLSFAYVSIFQPPCISSQLPLELIFICPS